MNILTIGSDRKLFDEDVAVLERVKEYAKKVDEMHIVVFTGRGFRKKNIGNLHIYPTNSLSRFLYVFDALRVAKKIIGMHGAQVISVQDPSESAFVGYILKKKFSIPLQIQIHVDIFSNFFGHSPLNRLRLLLAKFLIPKADGLRVVSKKIKDDVNKKFPDLSIPIDVLPIFVDITAISEMEPKRNLKEEFPRFEHIIFMASRLTEEKRIDIGLKAFAKVLKKFPKVGLIIAGSGPERRYLENVVHELGLTDHVVFIGWQNDLVSLYKTADVFLLTSEYEGYGMTLVEAAAAGCPIVTTRVGIADSPLFQNGVNAFICAIGDSECLSMYLSELISDGPKRNLFKLKMRDSITRNMPSREEYVETYVSLLKKLS